MIRFLQTPGPIKKVLLGGLLTIICVFMVITLVPGFGNSDFFGGSGPRRGVVATVGDQDVTADDVQNTAKQMLQQQFPKTGPQTAMLLPLFAGQAAQQLITQKAVLVEAERMGLRATDQEVVDELQKGPASATFFPGGKFIGQDEYERLLQQNNLTVAKFEQGIKDQIKVNKLRGLITGAAAVSDAEIRKEFEQRNTKVKFEYAVLRQDDILKTIRPSEAELQAFYDRNKANYTNSIPEKRKIQYVLLSTQQVQSQVPVTQQDLQTYYDQHRDEFRMQERVNVRHILIKTPPAGADGKIDPKAIDAARQKAQDVLRQLKSGAKFEDLAKKDSQDPGSAANGGSIGWIVRGQTVPEFEKAAFSMPKGATSDLVQSSFGFHIIHVDDKEEAHVRTLAEVKAQIEPLIRQQKAAQLADNQASTLLTQARSAGLDKAAAAKGLQVVTTDFVSQSDTLPGLGSSPQFMNAVFSQPANAQPDEAQLPQGYAIYKVLEIKPAATPTFQEIRSRVESEFKNQRASMLLAQKTQELSDRAKAAHDLKKAAKELGATVKTSDLVLPDAQVPDIGSMSGPASVAFTMKSGEISGPINNGSTGAVLAVLDKQAPSDQDYAAKKDGIREALRQNKQQETFGLFLMSLRDQMEKSGKIKINQDELKVLTKSQAGEEGE